MYFSKFSADFKALPPETTLEAVARSGLADSESFSSMNLVSSGDEKEGWELLREERGKFDEQSRVLD